jgi:mono/diheme cytochrome c family protein
MKIRRSGLPLAVHRGTIAGIFRRVGAIAILVCFSLQLRAQVVEHGGTRKSNFSALSEVPAKARGKQDPLERDREAIAAGGKLFEQHCSDCHVKKAGGTRRGVSLLGAEVQQATPGALFWVLTNGVVRRGMPVWSKLPEPERWQIVTFLKSLGTFPQNSAEPESTPVR